MAFIDDVTLSWPQKTVAADVRRNRIAAKGLEVGLTLNSSKREVVTSSGSCGMAELTATAYQQLTPATSLPLVASLTSGSAMDECLNT